MRCPGCGEEVADKLWFCPHCETSLRDKGVLPVRIEGGPAPELEEAVPEETPEFDEKLAHTAEHIHRSIKKAWIVRIGIAVFIITLLIVLLLILNRSTKGTLSAGFLLFFCASTGLVWERETTRFAAFKLLESAYIGIERNYGGLGSSLLMRRSGALMRDGLTGSGHQHCSGLMTDPPDRS